MTIRDPLRRIVDTRSLLVFALLLVAGIAIPPSAADARLGGGSSFGSRGGRTFSMPSATSTAPRMSPIQRSQTAAPFNNGSGFGAARPGFLGGGGLGRGLLGGFLGAGLFGMLFGGGLMGGLGGGFSVIGLLLQLGLLYFAFRFIIGFFRNRQSAFGNIGGSNFFSGSSSPAGDDRGNSAPVRPTSIPITINAEDYQSFERRLDESQIAYSSGDIATLQRIATAEMVGNFEQELRDNRRKGVVNKISDVHLVSGDLAEAWREASSDYATVAMRFSLIDVTFDHGSNRVVAGDVDTPQTVTEVWTFTRPSGSGPQTWLLSAIQQA